MSLKRGSWTKIAYAISAVLMVLGHTFYNGSVITCIISMMFLPVMLFALGSEFAGRGVAEGGFSGSGSVGTHGASKFAGFFGVVKRSFFAYLLPVIFLAWFKPIITVAVNWEELSAVDAVKKYFDSLMWGYGGTYGAHYPIGFLFIPLSLFWISILYAFIRRIAGKHFSILIAVLLSGLGFFLSAKQIALPLSLNATLVGMVFYAAGAFFEEHKEFFYRFKFVFIGISVPVMAVCTYKEFYFFPESGIYATPLCFVNALAGVIIITSLSMVLARFTGPVGKIIGTIGYYPITFLCLHYLDGSFGKFWGLTESETANGIIRILVLIVMSLIVGKVFAQMIPEGVEEEVKIKLPEKFSKNTKKVLNVCFYILFAIAYTYRFFNTTMFTMLVRDWKVINLVYDISVLLIALMALWNIVGIEKKLYKIGALIVVISAFMLLSRDGTYEVFVMLLLVIAAIGRDFKPMLIISVIIGSLMMIAAYQASMHGYIPYLVYDTGGEYGSHAFGIVYRTDFAAHVLYLAMSYAALRKDKITSIGYMVLVFATWFVWRYVHARMNTFCMILFLVGYAVFILLAIFGKKLKIPKWFCVAHLVANVGAIAGSMILGDRMVDIAGVDAGSLWARFQMSKQAIVENGVHLLGRNIYEQGAGGLVDGSNPYFFLDITYVRTLMLHGVVIAIIYLVIMTVASYRASKEGHTVIAIALLIVAIVSLIEHHATEISYNVFMFAAFANMGNNFYERKIRDKE